MSIYPKGEPWLCLAIFVMAAVAIAAMWIAPAGAQMACGKRADLVRQLGEKYGETRRSMDLADGIGVVEFYASKATGSWTILITSPQGTACMMAAGQAFKIEMPAKASIYAPVFAPLPKRKPGRAA